MKQALGILAVWLVAVNAFGLLALNRFNLNPDNAYRWMDPKLMDPKIYSQDRSGGLVGLHAHWDSRWYLGIAEEGYAYGGANPPASAAFTPLYPAMIRAAAFATGKNAVLAGWILSVLFLAAAVVYLWRLAAEFHPDVPAHLAVWFLLVFPTAFFLNAVYTESLFLFLSLGAFYHARKGNFFLAGVFGFWASLARLTGALLFIPLACEYFQTRVRKRAVKGDLAFIFLPVLGAALFFGFTYFRFGDFFSWSNAMTEYWGRDFTFRRRYIPFISPAAAANFAMDAGFAVFATAAACVAMKKLRLSYGLYMLPVILVPLSSGLPMSIGRYVLALFPMYLLMAGIKNSVLRQGLAFASALLLAMNITLFVNNYWAG